MSDRIGLLPMGALLVLLTGCTAYVQEPGPRVVYASPPPVVVESPPVVVELPRVAVAPPPVYIPPPAPAEPAPAVEIRAESDFYEPLTPYGHWEVIEPYGRCWVPARVQADWRPYCNGHWERTEAGWYWASDEPWAWATYHYGRWDFHARFGWYWVPQVQWAPAWVSWHRGEGFIGWAPLHPSVRVAVGVPVEVDVRPIHPRGFVFVEEKHFLEPVRPTTVIVNNTTIINKTVNITNVKVVNNTVINEGPRTQIIEQVTGRKVQPIPVHELRHKEEAVVLAARPNTPTVKVERPPAVVHSPEPHVTAVQVEDRARELHQKAHEDSASAARDLEKKAQLQAEQHTRELQQKAQADSQKHALELQNNARLQAEARSRELHQKATEEARQHAEELQKKAQLDARQHADELQKQAQLDSQQHAKELQQKAQLQAEQRAQELHQKAHANIDKAAAQDQRRRVQKPVPPGAEKANEKKEPKP